MTDQSEKLDLSFLETFSAILQDELDRRQSRLLERRYQLSGLDERASLAEFDWGYNPKIPKRTCFELHVTDDFLDCTGDFSSDGNKVRPWSIQPLAGLGP